MVESSDNNITELIEPSEFALLKGNIQLWWAQDTDGDFSTFI